VLRFYEWAPATLSLGYFQRYAERAAHPASAACDVVRRASGGGAILHDRELTYSLVLPVGHPLAARAEPLYRAVHQALIDVLAEVSGLAGASPSQKLDARFWDDVRATDSEELKITTSGAGFACGDAAKQQADSSIPVSPESPNPNPQSSSQPEPFLCFQRRSPGDLVLRPSGDPATTPGAWHKILGSAQRRRHGAVLQHGSLLLARSEFAPELAGIDDLAGTDFAGIGLSELRANWGRKLASVLNFELLAGRSSAQVAWAAQLAAAREKFHEHGWLHSR
jgi:lipoate-protein ligase A